LQFSAAKPIKKIYRIYPFSVLCLFSKSITVTALIRLKFEILKKDETLEVTYFVAGTGELSHLPPHLFYLPCWFIGEFDGAIFLPFFSLERSGAASVKISCLLNTTLGEGGFVGGVVIGKSRRHRRRRWRQRVCVSGKIPRPADFIGDGGPAGPSVISVGGAAYPGGVAGIAQLAPRCPPPVHACAVPGRENATLMSRPAGEQSLAIA
jgi:hypothetical protein